jgi:DNA-binding HxlR family transcriptional regulator
VKPRLYADLRRVIPRLSDKMLTQRLRNLQEQGLVERTRNPLGRVRDWGQRMAQPLGAIIESKASAVGT